MKLDQLHDWLDRHHVHVLRMEAVLPDGVVVGDFLHRDEFVRALPLGAPADRSIVACDIDGVPLEERASDGGEAPQPTLFQRPDLATLITDGTDPDLGHCIVELVDEGGNELALSPRTLLRRTLEDMAEIGLGAEISLQLQFNLFNESFADARRSGYRDLTPCSVSASRVSRLNRDSYACQPFMREAASRLEWRGIEWTRWHVDGGPGTIALTLAPADPLTAADRAIRAKQALFEVAFDLSRSLTFMAQPVPGNECFVQIECELQHRDAGIVLGAEASAEDAALLRGWSAGLEAARPAASALLYPTINSYRALSRAPAALATEQYPRRIRGSGDLNPYLALTAILGAGVAGIRSRLAIDGRQDSFANGSGAPDLPATLAEAAQLLAEDRTLTRALGSDFLRYWVRSRIREEHLHAAAERQGAEGRVSDWELKRYFELS